LPPPHLDFVQLQHQVLDLLLRHGVLLHRDKARSDGRAGAARGGQVLLTEAASATVDPPRGPAGALFPPLNLLKKPILSALAAPAATGWGGGAVFAGAGAAVVTDWLELRAVLELARLLLGLRNSMHGAARCHTDWSGKGMNQGWRRLADD
jgi:hypothetical protein